MPGDIVEDREEEPITHRDRLFLFTEPDSSSGGTKGRIVPPHNRASVVTCPDGVHVAVPARPFYPAITGSVANSRLDLVGTGVAVCVHHLRDDRLITTDHHTNNPYVLLTETSARSLLRRRETDHTKGSLIAVRREAVPPPRPRLPAHPLRPPPRRRPRPPPRTTLPRPARRRGRPRTGELAMRERQTYSDCIGAKRAKRRRRERKRERRETDRQSQPLAPVPAGVAPRPAPLPPQRPHVLGEDDSPGDLLAREHGDDIDEGGTAVREPRRPKPHAPLAGAAALELPTPEIKVG
jgi:hypothetical protein